MSEDELDVLELLIRHELAIKQLYEIFAVMFTDRQAFWQRLAGDEQKHANWIGMLRTEANMDKLLLHGTQLKPQAIKLSIRYVESQTARAQEGNLSLLQAISIAKDLESALLEKQFSKLNDFVPKEIMSTLMDLAVETEKHRKALVEALNNEKR